MATDTIWLYKVDEPTSYHDDTCRCDRHCGNCGADLDGHDGCTPRPKRAKYCSDYCRDRAKYDRAFSRALASRPTAF